MFYPPEFVAKVKRIYPTWTDLHQHLDAGDMIVGRYLDDSRYGGVGIGTILKAKTLEEVQDKTREGLEREQIYSEWCDLYDVQRK